MPYSRIVKTALWISLFFGLASAVMFGIQATGYHVAASITQGVQQETAFEQRNTLIEFAVFGLGISLLDGYALVRVRRQSHRDVTSKA
jgi:hypothetical protein